jgi:hypothetical protein
MMSDTIWSFETARFRIELNVEPEYNPDFSLDETGETEEKVRSGEWECVCFAVKVFFDGEEIASEYLSNSIYADVRDFRDHIGSHGEWGSYFADMVRQACRDARKELQRRGDNPPRLRIAA